MPKNKTHMSKKGVLLTTVSIFVLGLVITGQLNQPQKQDIRADEPVENVSLSQEDEYGFVKLENELIATFPDDIPLAPECEIEESYEKILSGKRAYGAVCEFHQTNVQELTQYYLDTLPTLGWSVDPLPEDSPLTEEVFIEAHKGSCDLFISVEYENNKYEVYVETTACL